jgi:hypothetical protein
MPRMRCRHAAEHSRANAAVGRTISAELGLTALPALVVRRPALGWDLAARVRARSGRVRRATAVRATVLGRLRASPGQVAVSRPGCRSGMRRQRRRPGGPCGNAGVSARRPSRLSRRPAYRIRGRARIRRSRRDHRPLSPRLPRFRRPRHATTRGRKGVLRGRIRAARWAPRARIRVRLEPRAPLQRLRVHRPPVRRELRSFRRVRPQPVPPGQRRSRPARPRRPSRRRRPRHPSPGWATRSNRISYPSTARCPEYRRPLPFRQ